LNPIAKSTQNPIGEATQLKDASKPVGEACRDDGTLKDASEIEWLYSLSDPSQSHLVIHGKKRKWNDSISDEDVDDIDVLPKTNVSMMFHSFNF
jgi:hypothetical protein